MKVLMTKTWLQQVEPRFLNPIRSDTSFAEKFVRDSQLCRPKPNVVSVRRRRLAAVAGLQDQSTVAAAAGGDVRRTIWRWIRPVARALGPSR